MRRLLQGDGGRILLDDVELQRLKKHQIAQPRRRPHLPEHPALRRHDGAAEPRGLPLLRRTSGARSPKSSCPALSRRTEERARRRCAGTRCARFDLARFADALAADLSYGNQKLLEIARATMLEPKVLMLDEPAAGLNHGETDRLQADAARASCAPDRVMIIVEHDMSLVMTLSDHIFVLHQGRLLFEGTPAAGAGQPRRAGGLSWQPRRHRRHPRRCSKSSRIESGYGRTRILKGIDLRLLEGEVVAIVGPERRRQDHAAQHHQRPCDGPRRRRSASPARRITGWPAYRIARRGISHCPEGRRIFQRLTVEENLVAGYVAGPRTELRRAARPGLRPVPDPARAAHEPGERALAADSSRCSRSPAA